MRMWFWTSRIAMEDVRAKMETLDAAKSSREFAFQPLNQSALAGSIRSQNCDYKTGRVSQSVLQPHNFRQPIANRAQRVTDQPAPAESPAKTAQIGFECGPIRCSDPADDAIRPTLTHQLSADGD